MEGIGQVMIFLSAVGAALYGFGWYPEGVLWQVVTKGSAVTCLAIFVLVTTQSTNHLILLLALIASVFGDVLLAIPAENSFLRGLIAFFISHVFYVGLFLKNRLPFEDISGMRVRIAALLWAVAAVAAFFLYPNLGDMVVPVFAYTAVLTLMATAALFSRFPVKLVGTGGILFLISDSFLGFEAFAGGVPYGGAIVWTTYYLAQLFLALGVMLHDERPTNFGGYRFD